MLITVNFPSDQIPSFALKLLYSMYVIDGLQSVAGDLSEKYIHGILNSSTRFLKESEDL